jgi:hypothetical protein
MIKKFAEIDNENIVLRVINAESKDWCEIYLSGRWIETFDNGVKDPLASIGYKYDDEIKKFIPKQFATGWIFDKEEWEWLPPFEKPQDDKMYIWSNEDINWKEVQL